MTKGGNEMTAIEYVTTMRWNGDAPCGEALRWIETLPSGADSQTAWRRCKRPDWMVWMLNAAGIAEAHERELRLFAVSCARRALLAERKAGREPDERLWAVLRIARRMASGDVDEAARYAARSAAWSSAWSAQADSLRRLIPRWPGELR